MPQAMNYEVYIDPADLPAIQSGLGGGAKVYLFRSPAGRATLPLRVGRPSVRQALRDLWAALVRGKA